MQEVQREQANQEFSRETVKNMLAQSGPCVSIYLPYDQKDTLSPRNGIHLKSLLQQAEEILQSMNVPRNEIENILGPGNEIVNNEKFWQTNAEGLALFLAPDFVQWIEDDSRAVEFTESVAVSDHFVVKPLLPLLTGNGQFYILTLAQSHVGLLRASRDHITPIKLEGVPLSVTEALGDEKSVAELQGRPMNAAGGEQTGVFGGYDPSGYSKDRVIRFFREVDKGVHKYLAGKNIPLIIAGLEYLHPIYREANTYPHLVEEGIKENAETLQVQELHQAAWSIIEPLFQQASEKDKERYHIGSNAALINTKLAEILPAAHFARVDTLFIAEGQQQYGMFDAESNRLEVHNDKHRGSVDLYDEAATYTLLNGGVVYILKPENMPDPHLSIAAIFRY